VGSTVEARGKSTGAKSTVSQSMDRQERERSVNSQQVAALQQAVANTQVDKESYHFLNQQVAQYSKYQVVNTVKSQENQQNGKASQNSTSLKKVIPHPSLLRQAVD